MPETISLKPTVRIKYDNMEAYMSLPKPEQGEEYKLPLLLQTLTESGVHAGIDQEILTAMLSEKAYDEERLVASGVAPVDGIDGYYEYNFDTTVDKKPKVLPDGSVDYWSVHSIEEVVEGQVIAVYHPAIPGKDGVNVKGQVLQAKRAREQQALKGKGFTKGEDNVSYVSSMDGKIEMQNDRIIIQQIHEVFGNVDLRIGNIDFHGDVVVHGNVESGVAIKASGSITVDGMVEGCELNAGKDIILRNGMQGGNKALVRTKGNVTARFFEFTRIECDGMLQTDVLLDCVVHCKSRIVISGKKGKIIGGDVRAVEGVEVYCLGNDAEKKTEVTVGAETETCIKLRALEVSMQEKRENLDRIEEGLAKFAALEAAQGVSYANDPRRMSLLRVKIQETATLASDEVEAKKMRSLVERGKGATVTVTHSVYPGVIVYIDDMRFSVNNFAQEIEFYKRPDKIATRPYYGNMA